MKTLFDKIWEKHRIVHQDSKDLLYIDLHLIHEVTSPQAFDGLRINNRKLRRPDLTFATMDHNTPTIPNHRQNIKDPLSAEQLNSLAENCRDFDIKLFDMESDFNGIVHMIGPELGLSLPGKTIVCGDSHTATHGALGAIAFGIGTSEVESVFATQCIWQTKPKNMGVKVIGKKPENVFAKDIILKLIAENGIAFGNGYAVEYYGEAIEDLNMEERMTICNMSIEAGAKFGIIKPDSKTIDYIADKPYTPKGKDFEIYKDEIKDLYTDDESDFDKIISLDISELKPQVSYGTNPAMTLAIDELFPAIESSEDERAYQYMDLKPGMKFSDIPVKYVFIGSCTNGRINDLRIAAKIMENQKVADNINCIVVPGSMQVLKQAEKEGLVKIFEEAGCEMRFPGCSYCLAMNEDRIEAGTHCASTSNRNFEGRQGENSRTHLMSPYMAAKQQLMGGSVMNKAINTITSEAIVIFKDNIDTDILIPKNYLKSTKRTGFEDALFAPWRYDSDGQPIKDFVLNQEENKDKKILIVGENFGCGSSREHAAWALQDYGIEVVIAGGYSPIFYMNYINNLKLPIILKKEERLALIEMGSPITVDLEARTVKSGDLEFHFKIENDFREKLLNGRDNIAEILLYEDLIKEYEDKYAK